MTGNTAATETATDAATAAATRLASRVANRLENPAIPPGGNTATRVATTATGPATNPATSADTNAAVTSHGCTLDAPSEVHSECTSDAHFECTRPAAYGGHSAATDATTDATTDAATMPGGYVPETYPGTARQVRTRDVPDAGHGVPARPFDGHESRHLSGQPGDTNPDTDPTQPEVDPANRRTPTRPGVVPAAFTAVLGIVHFPAQPVPGGHQHPDMSGVALAYAAAGVPVVPLFEPSGVGRCACGAVGCKRPGKHPRNPGGLSAATTDTDTIRAWWTRWPGANVGGLTGVLFDVCDVDGPDGIAAVRPLLEADHGRAPLIRTGSGGWHLLYTPTGMGNRVRFLPGVDWRGKAGYVVLPPSLHASGRRYELTRPGQLHDVPAALMAALTPSAPTRRSVMPPPAGRRTGYGPAALAREADAVAAAAEGGRNHVLNRAAFSLGQLVATGHLSEAEVTDALVDAALGAGLDEAEATRTIASGLRAGLKRPRTPRTLRRAA